MKLLSKATSNAKTKKNLQFEGFMSFILYLAPASEARTGVNLCPASSAGCRKACLFTAGLGKMPSVIAARIRKTLLYLDNPSQFLQMLQEDLEKAEKKAKKAGKNLAIRLNGTSDIAWESTRIIDKFPQIQFYDYTKDVRRLGKTPANYHLTLSASEVTSRVCQLALQQGHNVAVVFRDHIPESYWNHKVLDGDAHDLRFLDERGGRIVGLIAKGSAKKDTSGFVKESA
jgi:hypothetical protein